MKSELVRFASRKPCWRMVLRDVAAAVVALAAASVSIAVPAYALFWAGAPPAALSIFGFPIGCLAGAVIHITFRAVSGRAA